MTTPIPAQFGEGNTWLGQGFGLALRGSYPVDGLATRDASSQAIPTALLLEDDAQAPISLPAGERLREMRYPDGRLGMTIEDHHELGYRICNYSRLAGVAGLGQPGAGAGSQGCPVASWASACSGCWPCFLAVEM